MKMNRRRLFLCISAVILLAGAIISELIYFSDFEYHFRTKRFNRILTEKEKVMEGCLNDLKQILANGEPHGSKSEKNLFMLAGENEITILEYIDKKLIHWSDNEFDVPVEIHNDSLFAKPILFIHNGWFLPMTIQAGNEMIAGLLRVRTDYGFENDIIRNGFKKNFKIPDDVGFSTVKDSSEYNIYSSSGDFLFSLSFPAVKSNTILIIAPVVFWALLFVILILLVLEVVELMVNRGMNILGLLTSLALFVLLYFSVLLLKKPEVILRTGLFSPYHFSLNVLIPSLGHLLLLSILTAVFSFCFYKYLPAGPVRGENKMKSITVLSIYFSVAALFSGVLHYLFIHLVSDSNISFETYRVLDLTLFSAAGYCSIILFSLVPFFVLLKVIRICNDVRTGRFVIALMVALIVLVILFFRDPVSLLIAALFFSGIVILILIAVRKKTGYLNITVLFSILLGLYSLFVITVFSEKKNTENLKIQALSFSTENDPEAEHLLLDMWPVIKSDTILAGMMKAEIIEQKDVNSVTSYLQEKYFSGYWGNFNVNIILCPNGGPLRIGPGQDNLVNCFEFFYGRTKKYGHRLTGTDFYFIDYQGGRAYYIGQLFFETGHGTTNGLFIELYSNVTIFQSGYSELLLDRKFRGYSGLKDYSFAKYINGKIVLNSGEFAYNKEDDDYIDKNTDYRYFNAGSYKHVLCKNGNATVIISRKRLTTGDMLISFAYLFTFILLFTNLVLLLLRRPDIRKLRTPNLRQKLQLSFIGILLFSFILIGVVVTSLTINEYKAKHYDTIREKLNSIYIELENSLAGERSLSVDWRNSSYGSLNELLVGLSNIFNTDINIYNLNGHLMATSREEIYYRNLTSRRMNIQALINMETLTRSEYIQTEKVGRMNYLSVYVPFYNADNKLLVYLNLPYFRMQSILAREISNMVVVVINFTLLLILVTMGLAVFLSGRLTSPLSMLSDGLASVKLGKKVEHLPYNGTDEIGDLVMQYNSMVDELEESTEKLSNSEREYAWREMAKQIAHEIKNPLTPMKLNVQQLLKTWKDGAPRFDEKIETFSKNQIELIDNLSSIASAFSAFAKMPGTSPGLVNLLEQIQTTLELFRNTTNVTFWVRWPHESKVYIYADKEQLNGIFSNLFKNSIQAIPPDRKGLIKVSLEIKGDKIVVAVEDNGTGIPEPLQKKLFTPNFTTKSSGTGLGLSIVKKYVEGVKGRIWFESEADKGTIFYIEFPLMYTVEKPGEAPAV
jgi:two-component system nitrogen regulation sensor histidine kinase NtrY